MGHHIGPGLHIVAVGAAVEGIRDLDHNLDRSLRLEGRVTADRVVLGMGNAMEVGMDSGAKSVFIFQ